MSAEYQITVLENGITVASASMPQMASVCLGIWVRTGSRYEDDPRQNGVSHFIEHLLFKGTTNRDALKISEDVEGIGGSANAFTAEENTCYYARGRCKHLEELMDVQMDMYCNSTFLPAEIRKEREVIAEEIAMTLDQPSQYVQELLNTIQWKDHPLGRPVTGTEEGLSKIRRAMILDYLHRHYVGSNTWIIAAGNVEHQKLVTLSRKYTKGVPIGEPNHYSPFVPAQKRPQVVCLEREVDQTQFNLGFRTFPRSHPYGPALRIINTLAGENSSSHLFQVVREDRGLAYSIGTSVGAFYDTGDLVIGAGVDEDKVEKTVKLVVKEMKRLAAHPVPADVLRRAKDYIIGQFEMYVENTENQMTWFGEQLLGGGKFILPSQIERKILRTTAAEVRGVLKEILKPERVNLAIVGGPQNENTLQTLLESSF